MYRHRSFLIVFASRLGHTRHIAGRLAAAFEREGIDTTIVDAGDREHADLGGFSTVIAISSVHFDRPSRPMIRWLRHHRSALRSVPLEIVSVSLTAASPDAEARRIVERYARPLIAASGTEPALCEHVGGALQYTRYGALKRMMVQRVAGARGLPTDATRDVDLTDWDQLGRFVARTVALTDRLPASAGATSDG